MTDQKSAPADVDKGFRFVWAFNQPAKLVDVPVRSDANIRSGKGTLKLQDLRPGQVVSLQLTTDRTTGLVIVGIQVIDKDTNEKP